MFVLEFEIGICYIIEREFRIWIGIKNFFVYSIVCSVGLLILGVGGKCITLKSSVIIKDWEDG